MKVEGWEGDEKLLRNVENYSGEGLMTRNDGTNQQISTLIIFHFISFHL